MPNSPIKRKLKQTKLPRSFQQIPKKQSVRDDESGETSQGRDNIQEMMASSYNEENKEGPSKDPQQREEKQNHSFQFRFESEIEPFFVVCDTSKTVLNALNTSDSFRINKNLKTTKKEMVIQRSDGAAVKTDFPCCLIEKEEILDISFIKKIGKASTEQETQADLSFDKKNLVTFTIKTTGKENMIYIMKNTELKNKADYVCVYAFKEEKIQTALERDGRFIDRIFQKHCVLSLESEGKAKKGQKSRYDINMITPVDLLDKKTFQIIAIGDRRSNIQKKPTKTNTKPNVASAADSEKNDPGQHPTNTEQKTTQERKTKSSGLSTKGHATQNTSGNSFSFSYAISADIKDILQTRCEVLLEMLKNPEDPQIKEIYQEEYDKGLQSFTNVKNVKQLMKLSDSVCLLIVENSASGTGFLLFDRFILTNAHVVKDFVYSPPDAPRTLTKSVTAVFNYEVLGSEAKVLQVKDVVAYRYEKDDKHSCHDFALLELEAAPDNCTELLERCNHAPSPNSGGIYIVGHPGCEVKKMDPCFIVGIENRLQSINKHISENVSCPYVSWHCWPYLYQNQITYHSDFFHGSSGSPVFDEHCYLIGMHSGGFHYKVLNRSVIEFSVSIQSIIENIITQVETKSDIFELLYKFQYIKKIISRADMPMREERPNEEVEDMDVN